MRGGAPLATLPFSPAPESRARAHALIKLKYSHALLVRFVARECIPSVGSRGRGAKSGSVGFFC